MSRDRDPIIHVWVTKYALSQGIFEADAQHCQSVSERMICIPATGDTLAQHYHKPDWHTSREEAVAHARAMRDKKIVSLEKQLKKLRGMEF